jgi:propane monooxygenase coupling protein
VTGPATVRDTVGISLMVSAETETAVELVREQLPDARVDFRDCYYKIERDGELSFDMAELSDRLGRPVDTDTFLVSMSSYYGRIDVGDGVITISADIRPGRFRRGAPATPPVPAPRGST